MSSAHLPQAPAKQFKERRSSPRHLGAGLATGQAASRRLAQVSPSSAPRAPSPPLRPPPPGTPPKPPQPWDLDVGKLAHTAPNTTAPNSAQIVLQVSAAQRKRVCSMPAFAL